MAGISVKATLVEKNHVKVWSLDDLTFIAYEAIDYEHLLELLHDLRYRVEAAISECDRRLPSA